MLNRLFGGECCAALPYSFSKGASGKEVVVVYSLPVKVLLPVHLWGGEAGCPGKALQVCHVFLVSLSADLWAPLAPQRTQFIPLPPRLLFLKIKVF